MLKSKECCVSREAREHYKDTLPIHLNVHCELSVNSCKVATCQPIVNQSLRVKTVRCQKQSLRWRPTFRCHRPDFFLNKYLGILLRSCCNFQKIPTSRASNRSCKLLHGEACDEPLLVTWEWDDISSRLLIQGCQHDINKSNIPIVRMGCYTIVEELQQLHMIFC